VVLVGLFLARDPEYRVGGTVEMVTPDEVAVGGIAGP